MHIWSVQCDEMSPPAQSRYSTCRTFITLLHLLVSWHSHQGVSAYAHFSLPSEQCSLYYIPILCGFLHWVPSHLVGSYSVIPDTRRVSVVHLFILRKGKKKKRLPFNSSYRKFKSSGFRFGLWLMDEYVYR